MLLSDNFEELREYREKLIIDLDNLKSNSADNPDSLPIALTLAENLFSVDLTMYSGVKTLNSLIYHSFAISQLDNSISLHPEQIEIINQIQSNDGIILSAPTSFGKTFCVFEYIARDKPKNIVLVVPTLALVDEYNKKI